MGVASIFTANAKSAGWDYTIRVHTPTLAVLLVGRDGNISRSRRGSLAVIVQCAKNTFGPAPITPIAALMNVTKNGYRSK